jgi:apolipoprotein N-acyltransferase
VLRGGPLPRRFALVQPNIDQKDKLNPALVPAIFDIHAEMTEQAALDKPGIIIWPETAIFSYLLHDGRLLPRLRGLARESKAWIIFGTPHYAGGKAYNSIVAMSPEGEIVSRYDKQRLVPFGEYLPFRRYLYPMLKGVGYYDSEFSPGAGPRPVAADGLKLAAAVCFESTFPELIRERVLEGPDLILLVTNDAWFGDSSVLDFHLSTAVFRAVENRKYFIQAGNTGYSALIDPYGRMLKRSEVNRRQILTFEVPLS